MDAHYDMVMKARAVAGEGKRWYFAYSTVLDREAFEEWRGQHSYDFFNLPTGEIVEALDVKLVYDFPSRWWGGRVAGLENAPGHHVFGCVFEIAEKDWAIVQHKEGAVTNMSIEREVRLKFADGRTAVATAFTTNPARAANDGAISPRFVEALVRGAVQAGLPAQWIESLKTP
jgi:gamma-glutamylcyclotransferase